MHSNRLHFPILLALGLAACNVPPAPVEEHVAAAVTVDPDACVGKPDNTSVPGCHTDAQCTRGVCIAEVCEFVPRQGTCVPRGGLCRQGVCQDGACVPSELCGSCTQRCESDQDFCLFTCGGDEEQCKCICKNNFANCMRRCGRTILPTLCPVPG